MIPRGYIPKHKISGGKEVVTKEETRNTTLVLCPNCGGQNETVGKYDENMDDQITCSSCRFTTAKWNYEYVK